ncbi:MAG: GyrI-like domain-containing protein [Gemmatimonadaceae bacterium]
MEPSSGYSVSVLHVAPRTIAAVHARLPSSRVPAEFKRYLDQVYAAGASGMPLDGQNVFLYRDAVEDPGQLDVEFGVGISAPIAALGDVRPVELPSGEVAMTTHRGAYTGLGAAHAAVLAWCQSHSRSLAGPRWEVYGHWTDGELPRTDIYYLLRSAAELACVPRDSD